MTAEKGLKYCLKHPDKKAHAKGMCRSCYNKHLMSTNPNYKIRQYNNHKEWENNNKDKVKEYQRKRLITHKERDKETQLKNRLWREYKITIEDYKNLLDKTNNTCYICGIKPYESKKLHIDHNHKTGEVRGLLCPRCNWYLGKIEKDLNILIRIKEYLNLS